MDHFGGFAAPMFALAGSAVAFVVKLYLDAAERRRTQFFELMQFIDSDRPIATKVAAVYELRRFPEHKDFIIRFCERQRGNVAGDGAQFLVEEFDETRKFFGRVFVRLTDLQISHPHWYSPRISSISAAASSGF